MSIEQPRPQRGGAPVGFITELDPVGAGAVLYLRLWNDGPDAQAQVHRDFAAHLGPRDGASAVTALEAICDICHRHGRRPLMRHGVSCRCLGGDESCFATFIGVAGDGDREDAMLIAATMIRADMAPSLVGLAETLGLALKRMTLAALRAGPVPAHPQTLH
ncbi:hypothetical protein [Pseudoruegeria sp. HB172150]|uniref:hypothetical protein n=1 Tax=Pseudoruegeria sp. HB172150 TaxID=2721164 RepID=UPI0015566735|nr:hypothetical protein [Pseudoruegeria sp. HB172150]